MAYDQKRLGILGVAILALFLSQLILGIILTPHINVPRQPSSITTLFSLLTMVIPIALGSLVLWAGKQANYVWVPLFTVLEYRYMPSVGLFVPNNILRVLLALVLLTMSFLLAELVFNVWRAHLSAKLGVALLIVGFTFFCNIRFMETVLIDNPRFIPRRYLRQ